MTRTHVKSQPALKSWAEVDAALKRIAECQNLVTEQEVEMNRRINEVKDDSALMTRPMLERIKTLEQHIKEFVDDHRAELEGKTKPLTFGRTGYRLSSRLQIPSPGRTMALLKSLGLFGCISTKESINKEAVKQLAPEQIAEVGAHVRQTDEFWYEINWTALDSTPSE